MRKIKMNEAVGVPDFIFESSLDIYEEIFKLLKHEILEEGENHFRIELDFKIGDLKFDTINFKLSFIEYPGDTMVWIRMGVSNRSNLTTNYFFKHNITQGHIDLVLDVAVPSNGDIGGLIHNDFLGFFSNHKNKMIESISHELMHVYESNKKGVEDTRITAEYQAANKVRTGLRPLDTFGHYLYYVSVIENIVRPSEVTTYLKLNQASRRTFLQFLKNNNTYKKLIDIQNFSYDEMRKELMNMMGNIEIFFENVGVDKDDYDDKTDEEKIDMLLSIYYNSLLHAKADSLREMLAENFIELRFGFSGDKDKFFRKFLRKISRFDSFEDFFRYEEKNFKFVATKMIKKISKVYSLFEEQKQGRITESRSNWTHYNKINKIQTKLLENLSKSTFITNKSE